MKLDEFAAKLQKVSVDQGVNVRVRIIVVLDPRSDLPLCVSDALEIDALEARGAKYPVVQFGIETILDRMAAYVRDLDGGKNRGA